MTNPSPKTKKTKKRGGSEEDQKKGKEKAQGANRSVPRSEARTQRELFPMTLALSIEGVRHGAELDGRHGGRAEAPDAGC